MSFQNDKEAFKLANTYGLNPPRATNPRKIRSQNTGKYEPDHKPEAATRCIVLAHWIDKTNLLVKYSPEELLNLT